MEIYTPLSNKELSQKKIEEYTKMAKIIQWSPAPSMTATAPELRTPKRSPTLPLIYNSPLVAP